MVRGYINPLTTTVRARMVRPKLPKRILDNQTMLFSIGFRIIRSQIAPISKLNYPTI